MKRYIILAMALLSLSTSSAWNKFGQQCIATLAEQNLTEVAKEQITRILDGNLASGAWWLQEQTNVEEMKHTGTWHFISVDVNLTSTTSSEKDGVVQIERCIEVLKQRTSHTPQSVAEALKTLIHLVADMHNISHVKIAGIPYSHRSFNFGLSNGKLGKKEVVTPISWRKFWDSALINRHASFSPEMFAEDLTICYGEQKQNFSRGTVREWAADMARLSAPLYKWAKPDYYMSREQNNRLELMNDKTMARAGYRLAALLNEIFQ